MRNCKHTALSIVALTGGWSPIELGRWEHAVDEKTVWTEQASTTQHLTTNRTSQLRWLEYWLKISIRKADLRLHSFKKVQETQYSGHNERGVTSTMIKQARGFAVSNNRTILIKKLVFKWTYPSTKIILMHWKNSLTCFGVIMGEAESSPAAGNSTPLAFSSS